jgi:hypothetical protein
VSRIRTSAPIDPNDRFADRIKTLEALVAELQRPSVRWRTITLASPNWTQVRTPEWRLNGGRIELRGALTRTTSTFPPTSNVFLLDSGNPPTPSQVYAVGGPGTIVASTPDSQYMTWVVDTGLPSFRSGSATFTLAVGDAVSLDGIWWPA